MKALSIKQPWANLIIHAGKDIENRTWKTTYRGRLAIHASKRKSWGEYVDAVVLAEQSGLTASISIPMPDECVYGAIIGTVDLIDCVEKSDSPWFCGPYGFVLSNPRPLLVPVLVRGSLGLWEWDARICNSMACKAYGEPIAEGHSCLP